MEAPRSGSGRSIDLIRGPYGRNAGGLRKSPSLVNPMAVDDGSARLFARPNIR